MSLSPFTIMEIITLLCSITAAAGTIACLIVSGLAYYKSRSALKISEKINDRFEQLDEAVVRSVMEEQGNAESEEIMKVFRDLRGAGMLSEIAIREAKDVVRKKK